MDKMLAAHEQELSSDAQRSASLSKANYGTAHQ